jgi:hypothetical protein
LLWGSWTAAWLTSLRGETTPVISWFINPINYRISTINIHKP